MTKHGMTTPDPYEVEINGFPEPSPGRTISWTWGEDAIAGTFSDTTELYIAPDEDGTPRWWRRIDESTVGHEYEPEPISFEDALNTVDPKYWPVIYCWTLETLAHEVGMRTNERWQQLLAVYPNAKRQLMELLIALLPDNSTEDESQPGQKCAGSGGSSD